MPGRNAWMPWLLLAVVAVGGWMAWPRQPASVPAAPEPRDTAVAPRAEQAAAPARPDPAARPTGSTTRAPLPAFLPEQAHATIALILQRGPFPYRQDGSVFGNREGHLPRKPRGWYREYTVETPGLAHRGARRIVTGGDPPGEWYYSDDHYDSFRRFEMPGEPR